MILKLSCPDRRGLVHEITGFLARAGVNILEMSQFTDLSANWFFMRTELDACGGSLDDLSSGFERVGQELGAQWTFRHAGYRTPCAILVSREAHCLYDLLARVGSGEIPLDVRAVLSNHESLRPAAERAGCVFEHLPIRKESRDADFARYAEALDRCGAGLVVLARFMQILPPDLCARHTGRIINIHHSFLPAFAGAQPYRQAFERGVKIIGATAHYVTAELDAGPIIEQEVSRVEHFHTPADLQRLGRDCECLALSRAVRYHCHDRILLHGSKTIVFRD
jgi:formyltetrahydrofolate deformylase